MDHDFNHKFEDYSLQLWDTYKAEASHVSDYLSANEDRRRLRRLLINHFTEQGIEWDPTLYEKVCEARIDFIMIRGNINPGVDPRSCHYGRHQPCTQTQFHGTLFCGLHDWTLQHHAENYVEAWRDFTQGIRDGIEIVREIVEEDDKNHEQYQMVQIPNVSMGDAHDVTNGLEIIHEISRGTRMEVIHHTTADPARTDTGRGQFHENSGVPMEAARFKQEEDTIN